MPMTRTIPRQSPPSQTEILFSQEASAPRALPSMLLLRIRFPLLFLSEQMKTSPNDVPPLSFGASRRNKNESEGRCPQQTPRALPRLISYRRWRAISPATSECRRTPSRAARPRQSPLRSSPACNRFRGNSFSVAGRRAARKAERFAPSKRRKRKRFPFSLLKNIRPPRLLPLAFEGNILRRHRPDRQTNRTARPWQSPH